jgi:glucose/arabinose dehydrogenase
MRIWGRAIAALSVAVLLLASCSDSDDDPPSGDASGSQTDDTDDGNIDSTAGSTTTGGSGDEEVVLTEVADAEGPIALAVEPESSDLYVAQREGQVVRLDPEAGDVGEPIIDISDRVSTDFERGLLGITFSPEGDALYLSYTNNEGHARVDRYPFAEGEVDTDGRLQIIGIEDPFPNHNGGQITFGPDGYLYYGMGDGGSAGDPLGTGQDTSELLGKMIRIDPSGDEDAPYTSPSDNPFADGGGAPEAWLYGVRNPWRFSFDRETGDLWIGDVGQDAIEEIDFLPATDGTGAGRGANLGWSEMEGTQPYDGGEEPDNHTPPIFEYPSTGEDCSVTGGYVYRGEALPWLDGAYLWGDFCRGEIRFLRQEGGEITEEGSLGLSVGEQTLASFGEDADGEIYVLSLSQGKVYRLDAA